jgi:hypothetical protein
VRQKTHILAIHAGFDELHRHQTPHWLLLLGPIDHSHAPFADLVHQLVRADFGDVGHGHNFPTGW